MSPLPQKGPDRQRLGVLSEFDRYSFRVGACRTFKGPLIMIDLFGWCDTRKKHWQPALRASPLSNRRLRRIEIIWMRHNGSLLTAPVATKHLVHVLNHNIWLITRFSLTLIARKIIQVCP